MSALVFCATTGTVRSIETAAPLTEAAQASVKAFLTSTKLMTRIRAPGLPP